MTRNIIFGLLNFVSTLTIGFIVSPMILRSLGDSRYGIWALFGELLIYFGLMDFGIRGSVSYFVGRSISAEKSSDVRRYISSAFVALAFVGAVVFAIAITLIFYFERELMGNYPDRLDVVGSAVLFSLLFCAGLPLETFAVTLVGARKAFLVSRAEIVWRIVSATLMLIALQVSPSLLVLCVAHICARLVYWAIVRHQVKKHLPEVGIDVRLASWPTMREMLGYGGKNSVIDVAWALMVRKDVMLTTAFHGPALVPTISFARQFLTITSMACSAITQAVRPNLLHHWTRNEKSAAHEIYYTIVRYSSFVVLMAAAFLYSLGHDFISLWIGARFVSGDPFFRTDYNLYILLTGFIPRALHSISVQFLYATNQQKYLSIMVVVESAVNLTLAFLLVRPYGTMGLAIAGALPSLASNLIVFPMLMRRYCGVSYRRYLLDGVGPSFLVCGAVFLIGLFLRQLAPVPQWGFLIRAGLAMGVTGCMLGYIFLLKKPHRERLISILRARVPKVRAA